MCPRVSGLACCELDGRVCKRSVQDSGLENTLCKHSLISVLQGSTHTESQAMCSFCKPHAPPLPSYSRTLYDSLLCRGKWRWRLPGLSLSFSQPSGKRVLSCWRDSMGDRSDWNENLKCFGVGSITLFDVVWGGRQLRQSYQAWSPLSANKIRCRLFSTGDLKVRTCRSSRGT